MRKEAEKDGFQDLDDIANEDVVGKYLKYMFNY